MQFGVWVGGARLAVTVPANVSQTGPKIVVKSKATPADLPNFSYWKWWCPMEDEHGNSKLWEITIDLP